ncbi:MAG: hypothetical protein FJ005_04515 [Chloroflexi bacterium]|nr:hypothetical protein [Chloroflexota bacterium]
MQQQYKCPNCGMSVAYLGRFCDDCGTQLNWPMQQQLNEQSCSSIRPSERLLDDIEEIASIKHTLSLKDRSLTSADGFYVQSISLPVYGTQYMAGGQFIAKIIFIRKPDGSRIIEKYLPGDWETQVAETLQICNALRLVRDGQKYWSPEKIAAYESPVVIDGDMLNKVSDVNRQHYAEINEYWHSIDYPRRMEITNIYADDLSKEWPVEYLELRTNLSEAKANKIAESLALNVQKAHLIGYMCGKGWISQKEVANANSHFGELIAGDIRSSINGARSKGAAFATSLMKISAIGHFDA